MRYGFAIHFGFHSVCSIYRTIEAKLLFMVF